MTWKVFKYGTGDVVPFDAKYLTTIVEHKQSWDKKGAICEERFVWHYFLVEVKK